MTLNMLTNRFCIGLCIAHEDCGKSYVLLFFPILAVLLSKGAKYRLDFRKVDLFSARNAIY